jgi:hypothetical protein
MTITTSKGEFLFYPMPDNMKWSKNLPNHLTFKYTLQGEVSEPFYSPIFDDDKSIRANYTIVSTTNDIMEEQITDIIDDARDYVYRNYLKQTDKDWNANSFENGCVTVEESFITLAAKLKLDLNNNYLILKKK